MGRRRFSREFKRIVAICREFALADDVREIKRAQLVAMFDELAKCPANASQRFPGLSVRDAIKANEAAGHPTLSPNSLRDAWLAPLKAIFSHAEDRELCSANPTSKIRIRGAERSGRGAAFQIDELNRLFQLSLFVGCRSASQQFEPGDIQIDTHEFWAPLLALFTGARTSRIHYRPPPPFATRKSSNRRPRLIAWLALALECQRDEHAAIAVDPF